MTKATATQVSGSNNIKLSLQRSVDRAVQRVAVGQHAGEALDDGAGRIRGDTADVAHRALAGRRDLLFGGGKPGGELVFQRLALGFRSRVQLLAGFVADRLGPRTRRSEFG